jgi:hypothetical protein
LTETTSADWDLPHRVMARRSFLISREAAEVMAARAYPVTDAVFALCSSELALTTGTILPVDSGVPMAFLG